MLTDARTTDRAESWALACDLCGHVLDPGALDAPNGGWQTQRAAYDAGEAHGWSTDPHGVDLCPECLSVDGAA